MDIITWLEEFHYHWLVAYMYGHMDVSKLMESLSIVGGKLLVLGDFNIPWNKEDHPEREQLYDLLSSCSLTQHVEFVTHLGGQTLDHVISRDSDYLVTILNVTVCRTTIFWFKYDFDSSIRHASSTQLGFEPQSS